MKRINLRRIMITLLAIYVLICIAVAVFQRSMLYFPPAFSPRMVDELAAAQNFSRWIGANGQPMGLKRPATNQPAIGQIMIVYGNGSSALSSGRYADQIQPAGDFDIYILEYPGYADRPGVPSQQSFFTAADEAFEALPDDKPRYILGESLGTGVAAHLAGAYSNRVEGIALLAPYNRLTDVAQYHYRILPVKLFMWDKYLSEDHLKAYHGPVAIAIAGYDTVVPQKFGRRLYDHYSGPKKLWEFPEANHGSITDQTPEFWKEIFAFWNISTNAGQTLLIK